MKFGRNSNGVSINRIAAALLLVAVVILLSHSVAPAQQPVTPKRIMVLYWYGRNWPGNEADEHTFQTVFQSAPGGNVEYYPEYLEADRFPGDDQAALLCDYLRKKYARRPIDVIVAVSDTSLRFLLKYRSELFPQTPIVFAAVKPPTGKELTTEPGITGIIQTFSYKQTLDLALQLHPGTEQLFIVSGTLNQDKTYETMGREKLQGYEKKLSITYLTDLSPKQLVDRTRGLPQRSIILYIWQQAYSEEGRILESRDVLSLITASAPVPVYGLASWQVGNGIVGGYVRITRAGTSKLAEIALQIANGERAQNIPVETFAVVPMFDWRQLQRWGIREELLPPGSTVNFRVPSFWEEYKWYAIGLISVVMVQSLLIAGLVINRSRRKRAEVERQHFATLVEAERRHLNEVISNVPGIAWESFIQPDSGRRKVAFVSQHVEKMLGYSVAEWTATPGLARSVVHEEDRQATARATAAILAGGKEDVIRFRCLAKDGRWLWVESHLAPVLDETGSIIGLRGVTIDITERKLAEEALRNVQESLTIALEASQMGTWDLDLTNDFSGRRNLRHDQIFGYDTPQAEWGQKIARHHIVEEDQETFDAAFARAMVTGELDFEARVCWPDGSIHWMAVRGRFYFDEKGQPTRGAGVNFDISEGKRAEAALRESEERFRNMADTVPVMIWLSGPDKRTTYRNQQWLNFTGRTKEDELDSNWAENIHPDDYGHCLETYNSAFDRREPFTIEYRLRRADGLYSWVLDSGTAWLTSGGDFLGYIGSCIDISERKTAEEILKSLSGQLIWARENECARIARELHDDLNQRMALIAIELEQLGQKVPQSDTMVREHLKGILKQTTDVSREIHQISHDLHPSKLSQLGLAAAIRSLCNELRSRHQLQIEFSAERMPADLSKEVSLCFYRITQECLNNVIKHSQAETVTIALSANGKEIRLRIADSGVGFDMQSPKTKKGLGLHSMRERLRLVGGHLMIRSRPEHGTQIDARVPMQQINYIYNPPSPDGGRNATQH
jgi:PAS domain S-box-containing protein